MSDIYVQPDWIPDSLREYESPWYRAPLPLPGAHPIPHESHSVGLRADVIGFSQNRFMGTHTYPTSNLCGYRMFRRKDVRASEISGVFWADVYGITALYGGTESDRKTWSFEYDYQFVNERDEDYVDPETGEHEERWKPVVKSGLVVEERPDDDFFPPGFSYSVGVDRGEHRWIDVHDEDGKTLQSKRNAGETTLTLPIDHTYFGARLTQWEGLPSTARRRTNGSGYYGPTVACSESTEGSFSYMTGGLWFAAFDLSADIPDDDERYFVHGWPDSVYVNVPHLQRRNAPVLRDSKHPDRDEIFNESRTEAILGNEITEHRWMDEYGAYDPVGDQRFRNCGWRPMNVEDLVNELVAVRPESQGGTSVGKLVPVNGVSTYRVTMVVRGFKTGESDLSDLKQVVFTASPDDGEFDLRLPAENEDSATGVIVSKLERKVVVDGNESWVEIPAAGAIAAMPNPGVLLLCIGRSRKGKRWGFPQYDVEHWPEQASELGAEYSSELRYFASQLFRHIGKATSET